MAYFNQYALRILFGLLNIVADILVVAVAIQNAARPGSPTNTVIYNVYIAVVALLLIIAEFRPPKFVYKHLAFVVTYRGRGLLFAFLACLVYKSTGFNIGACVFVAALGLTYFVVSFASRLTPPAGLVNDWRSWASEGTRDLTGNAATGNDDDGAYEDAGKTERIGGGNGGNGGSTYVAVDIEATESEESNRTAHTTAQDASSPQSPTNTQTATVQPSVTFGPSFTQFKSFVQHISLEDTIDKRMQKKAKKQSHLSRNHYRHNQQQQQQQQSQQQYQHHHQSRPTMNTTRRDQMLSPPPTSSLAAAALSTSTISISSAIGSNSANALNSLNNVPIPIDDLLAPSTPSSRSPPMN
ncbi:hypothetical protein GQ42DRAFT_179864 [Ramicandelaber brevisporus]|nr:hypothetical protein GQ42DRAFT_179864 [Ramicandelaber brevisporus]